MSSNLDFLCDSDPVSDDSSIGNILKSMGAITDEELSKILLVQSQLEDRACLGDLLVSLGIIGLDQLNKALYLQDRMRRTRELATWTKSMLDAMDDNVVENSRQVSRVRNLLDLLGKK